MKPHLLVFLDRRSESKPTKALVVSLGLLRNSDILPQPDALLIEEVYRNSLSWREEPIINLDDFTDVLANNAQTWRSRGVDISKFVNALKKGYEDRTLHVVEFKGTPEEIEVASAQHLVNFFPNGLEDDDIEAGSARELLIHNQLYFGRHLVHHGEQVGLVQVILDLTEGSGGVGNMRVTKPNEDIVFEVIAYKLPEASTGAVKTDVYWHTATMLKAVMDKDEVMRTINETESSATWIAENQAALRDVIVDLELDAADWSLS